MTATQEISTEKLKAALRKLAQQEPTFFLELLQQVVKENPELLVSQKIERRKRIEALVKEDFEKYASVFKALA